jgi:hypothetical protein
VQFEFPQRLSNCKLWETVGMNLDKFVPEIGQLVLAQGRTGAFKVLAVSSDGQTASIQSFNISRQKFVGKPLIGIPSSALLPWKEDASQAAARIVREAPENK